LSGIRTHDTGVQASEESRCIRPRGHCDRQQGNTAHRNRRNKSEQQQSVLLKTQQHNWQLIKARYAGWISFASGKSTQFRGGTLKIRDGIMFVFQQISKDGCTNGDSAGSTRIMNAGAALECTLRSGLASAPLQYSCLPVQNLLQLLAIYS
jgi:hypothetical protein